MVSPSKIQHSCSTLVRLLNSIGGVMVSVLALNTVDCGFRAQSAQIKDYKIGICCFSAKHATLRRKSKDRLAQKQDNVLSGETCLFADCCFSELVL